MFHTLDQKCNTCRINLAASAFKGDIWIKSEQNMVTMVTLDISHLKATKIIKIIFIHI